MCPLSSLTKSSFSLAVSVNHLDCRIREGYGRSIYQPLLPLILSRDISGEIAAVGRSVRSLRVGQEVFGALHPTAVRGTYADYAILAEDQLIQKPESLSHVGETGFLADRYGLVIGIPMAEAFLWQKKTQYRYSHGIGYWWIYMRSDAEDLQEIGRLSGAGKLKLPVEKTLPITQVREAHESNDKRFVIGKVVLEFD